MPPAVRPDSFFQHRSVAGSVIDHDNVGSAEGGQLRLQRAEASHGQPGGLIVDDHHQQAARCTAKIIFSAHANDPAKEKAKNPPPARRSMVTAIDAVIVSS
jgi:hypothetical protein